VVEAFVVYEAGDFFQFTRRKVGEAVGFVSGVVVPEVDFACCRLVEFDEGFSLASIVGCGDEVGWWQVFGCDGWEGWVFVCFFCGLGDGGVCGGCDCACFLVFLGFLLCGCVF